MGKQCTPICENCGHLMTNHKDGKCKRCDCNLETADKKPWQAKTSFPNSRYPHMNIISSKKKGKRLLDVALESWNRLHGSTGYQPIKDNMGAIGYIIEKGYVLTAKRQIYGNIISFSLNIINVCLRDEWILVLYLQDVDHFYEFDAKEVLEKGFRNIYNGQTMINCNIRLGRRHGYEPSKQPEDIEEH